MASHTHPGLLVTRLLVLYSSSWLLLVSLSATAAIKISSTPTFISPRTVIGPFFGCVLQSNDVGCSLSRWSVNGSTLVASGKYQIGPAPGGGYGLQVHNVAENDGGIYSCEFMCNGGEMRSASYNLTYYHDIVIHTANNIVYHAFLHDNVTLLCDADHVTERAWYYSNNSIIKLGGKYNKHGSSLVVQSVTPLEAIGYGCLIRNPAAVPQAIYNTIRVYAPPNITLSGPQSVEEGLSVVIHCSSYGIPKPTITWIRGSDVIVPGGRIEQTYGESGYHVSSSLTINQLHQSDNGDYRCSVANTNGTMFSITNITVTIPPQPFIDVLPIRIFSTNVTISLVVVLLNLSNGDTNVMVTWRPTSSSLVEGTIILPANESSSIVLYNLSPGTSYIVMASVLVLTDSAVFTTLSDTVVSPNLTLSSSLPHTPVLSSSIAATVGPIATQPLSEGIMFAIVGGGVLVVLMVMVMVTVIVMVCLLRSRRSKSKARRFNSSRSDASLMYHKQNSSTSNVSAVSSDSLIARSFTPNSLGPNVVQVVQQPAVYMPPHIMYHHENNFEMTDNVAFSDHRPTFQLGGDPASFSETASELHDPADHLQFEYTTNANYEGHTPLALRRDNPRFEIVSEGRHGDGRRRDVFETVKIKN